MNARLIIPVRLLKEVTHPASWRLRSYVPVESISWLHVLRGCIKQWEIIHSAYSLLICTIEEAVWLHSSPGDIQGNKSLSQQDRSCLAAAWVGTSLPHGKDHYLQSPRATIGALKYARTVRDKFPKDSPLTQPTPPDPTTRFRAAAVPSLVKELQYTAVLSPTWCLEPA